MDATLTILIRAQARQAQQQIAQTKQELSLLQRASSALNRTSKGGFFEQLGSSRLVKAGKNLQWLGRQMAYSFTLPVVLAGAALFKTTMEFEKSMTQLRKVYGTVEEDQAQLRRETDLLGESFKLLSTIYGVHVAEVAEVGAQWAAAGSAGRGLAENVKATMEAMILGDMEAEQATKSLIAIQAGWRLSTEKNIDGISEQTMALARLNIIENETAISFEDLIEVYTRAGGVARNAGFDFQTLGAFAASLVPTTGGAAQAGTALRSIISRLQSPTEQATDALRLMGIEVKDPSWMGAPVSDRILMVAAAYEDLSTANQGLVASVLASRWQVSRFSVMMADLNSEFGYYRKALDAASDDTKALETYQRELGEVLKSHPRRWEILKNSIRNTMMDAFIPMLPVIFEIIRTIAVLATAFSNLDPSTQKIIMLGLMFVALVGPIIMVVAAFMQLSGVLLTTVGFALSKVFGLLGGVAGVLGYLAKSIIGFSSGATGLSLVFGGIATGAQVAVQSLWAFGKHGGEALIKGFAAVPTVLGHVATEVRWFASDIAKAVRAVPTVLSHMATEISWLASDIAKGFRAVPTVLGHMATEVRWFAGDIAKASSRFASSTATVFRQIGTEISWLASDALGVLKGFYASMSALFARIVAQMVLFSASVKVHMIAAALWVRNSMMSMLVSLTLSRFGQALAQIVAQMALFSASVKLHMMTAALWVRKSMLTMLASLTFSRFGQALGAMAAQMALFATVVRAQFFAISASAKAATAQIVVAWAALGLPLWAVVAIIAAIVVALLAIFNDDFRNGIINAVKWVVEGLAKLPAVIATVFNTIIRFLAGAVSKIVEWLSYLNPFARHSPSLVDNVKAGVAAILTEYSKLNRIGGLISRATSSLQEFGDANASSMRMARNKDLREKAATPGVKGGSQLIESMSRLRVLLPPLSKDMEMQEKVVRRVGNAYEMASSRIEGMQDSLDSTKDRLEAVTAVVDAAQDRISELAGTPIKGMSDLSDQIFENEIAQNRLRMELLQFEKAGESVDSIRDKFAKLAGDIEMLRAKQTTLRDAGAGNDVLSVYDEQINALKAQQGEVSGMEKKVQDVQDKLEELDIEGRFLALTKSINFDPLERQIERMVDSTQEMSFGDIVSQIQEQKGIIAEMEPIRQRLVDQVRNEELAIDSATAAQEKVKLALDVQESKLQSMQDQYTEIESLIRDMDQALTDVASTLGGGASDTSFLDDMFTAGLDQDYDIFGDGDILGRAGDNLDIDAFNKEMEDLLSKSLGDLTIGDPFQPFKDKWTSFKEWNSREWQDFKDLWTEMPGQIWGGMVGLWDGIKKIFWIGFNAVTGFFSDIWDKIKKVWAPVGAFFSRMWGGIKGIFWTAVNAVAGFFGFLWGKIKAIWNTVGVPIWNAIKSVVSTLGTVISTVFGAIVGAIQTAWGFIQPIIMGIWGAIDGFVIPIFELFKVTALIVWALVSEAIQLAWSIIKWNFDQIMVGIGYLNVAWDVMKVIALLVWEVIADFIADRWADIETIFGWIQTGLGWLGVAWDVMKGLAVGAWGAVAGFVGDRWEDIKSIFSTVQEWLEDKLPAAWGFIRDKVSEYWGALADDVSTIWDNTLGPVFGKFMDVFRTKVKPAFEFLYNSVIKPIMGAIVAALATAWNAVAASIENGVNFFIKGFNQMAAAVNAVAGLLDIDSRVSVMEEISVKRIDAGISFKAADSIMSGPSTTPAAALEAGGVIGRMGGMVAGAHALVGEGSNIYPEYIIPTDPKHRTRATELHRSLANRLGSLPAFADGGILGGVGGFFKDTAKGAYDAGKGALEGGVKIARRGAVEALWKPARAAIEAVFNQIPVPMIKNIADGMLNVIEDWMSGSGAALDQFSSTFQQGERIGNVQAAMARGGFVVPQTQGGSLFRIGEGLHNEAVQVTPLGARSADSGTVNNFYGNLEFPNINDPDDVETFLKNLEALAH